MTTQQSPTRPLFVSVADFAQNTGIDARTIRAMARDGRLASRKTSPGSGGSVLILASEGDRLKQEAIARRSPLRQSEPDDGSTVQYNDEFSRAEEGDEFIGDDGFPLVGEELAQAKAELEAERTADAAKRREELKRFRDNRDRQEAAATALRETRQKKLDWLKNPHGGLAVLDALDPFTIADTLREARRAAAHTVAVQAVLDAEDGVQ